MITSDYLYDKHKRDQEARGFNKSTAWQKARKIALVRDNYLCQSCLSNKRIKKADVVHHIKELRDHPELSLTLSNLVSWCHTCHNRHHKPKAESEPKVKIDYTEIGANEELI